MPKADKNFFEKVYQVVRKIPEGRVSSYGAIARAIGSPQSARMVGWAMNASHNVEDVPAHRVVNRMGLLTGKHYFDGTNLMQRLKSLTIKFNALMKSFGILIKKRFKARRETFFVHFFPVYL